MGALDWHRAWGAVAADALADAVATLDVWPSAQVLDLGAAIGLAWPALAARGGRITAIELDQTLVEAGREEARRLGVVQVQGDGLAWLAQGDARFDLIWAGDVLWRNYFPDPHAVVRRLMTALAPGGQLAVYTANWYSSRFLWTYPDLERRLLTANARRWAVPSDGDANHHEQALLWLSAANAHDLSASLHPLVGHAGLPTWPAWRHYLETCVWPDYLAAADSAETDRADHARLQTLITPGSGRYLPASPGYVAFQPTLLATGRRGSC